MSQEERPHREQGNPSPWPVDLDELQARSLAGESIDVLEAFHDTVTDEMIEARLWARHPGKYSEESARYRERMIPRTKRLAAGRLLRDVFDEAVPLSSDLATFDWRLATFMSPAIDGVEYFYSNRPQELGMARLGRESRGTRSIAYLFGFCARKPGQHEEAVRSWAGTLNALYEDQGGVYDSGLSRMISDAQRLRPPKELKLPTARLSRIMTEVEPQIWENVVLRQRPHTYNVHTENTKLLITDLELSPVGSLDIDNVTLLQGQLLAPDFLPAPSLRQFIPQSLIATLNLIHSLAEQGGEDDDAIRKIDKMLRAKGETETIGYSDISHLANVITPALQTAESVELGLIDTSRVEDYPKAVDRILSFVLRTGRPVLEESDQVVIFTAAADCIRLMAFTGAEHKLQQRVLSIGDLVLRYTDLSETEQRYMIEQLQQRRSEATVHETYRELRQYHRSRGRRNKHKPGYGLLS